MKLAALLQFAADRKAGEVIMGPAPYDEVLAEFKRRVAAKESKPGRPYLQIWSGQGTPKKYRFDDLPANVIPINLPPEPSANKRAKQRGFVVPNEDDGDPG